MGPVDWTAVLAAAAIALGLGLVWPGGAWRGAGRIAALAVASFLAAAMFGHSFARIGAETMAAKPWLYPMQTGGIALAFVLPAFAASHAARGQGIGAGLREGAFWLVAYLAMGATFWALG